MKNIYTHLKDYTSTGHYPFHMPGHKRNPGFLSFDRDPVSIDVTELAATDNLQNPSGIIRETQERLADTFGADKSYMLANGSTGGIIAAILSAVCNGGQLIMARNSHMSAYSAVAFGDISPVYVYPGVSEDKIPGAISAANVKAVFAAGCKASAVFITSPTYEGIVSDIRAIAEITHTHNALLIVDEAHGAHFKFHGAFPKSAIELGADIVIQSLHKTLPSLTQTAVLHTKGSRCSQRLIRQFLNMVNSTSPSYILLSSIGLCLEFLEKSGSCFDTYVHRLIRLREALNTLDNFSLIDQHYMKDGCFAYDISKLVLLTNDGIGLEKALRENHSLAMETASDNFILAMTTVADTKEGFDALRLALTEFDKTYKKADKKTCPEYPKPITVLPVREALYKPVRKLRLIEAIGRTAAENIAPYPPGVPVCLPGELITAEVLGFLPKGYELREVNVLV